MLKVIFLSTTTRICIFVAYFISMEKLLENLVITIDGPAGSGKSTVSKMLAQKLGLSFLDTGAMYRAVACKAMQIGVALDKPLELKKMIEQSKFEFIAANGKTTVIVDQVDISEQIRGQEVTSNVKYVANSPILREILVEMQRNFAKTTGNIVTEGRDQGSVVFPNAKFKFYLDADVRERAMRRAMELSQKGETVLITDMIKAINERDISDKSREVGPLVIPDDAIIVDSTDKSIEQVVDVLQEHINQRYLEIQS